MGDVIDLNEKRDLRDTAIMHKDDHGVLWFKYSFGYEMEGLRFCFNAWARSDEEAQTKLLDAVRNATYQYRVRDEIPY